MEARDIYYDWEKNYFETTEDPQTSEDGHREGHNETLEAILTICGLILLIIAFFICWKKNLCARKRRENMLENQLPETSINLVAPSAFDEEPSITGNNREVADGYGFSRF